MAVNESLTVEQFADRYTFINGNSERQLENGDVLTYETTAGTRADDGSWLYVNLMLHSEAQDKLNDLAYKNDDGEMVVDYADMRNEFTSASASTNIGTQIPQTYVGEPIKVAVRMSEDDSGQRYLNVLKVEVMEAASGGTVSLNPASIEDRQEVPQ